MKQRVTLRNIAAVAGVHYSTVSLALRGNHQISPAERLRIQNIADQMGYAPDPMLSALNAYRKTTRPVHYQSTLAWINNWPNPDALRLAPTFDEYFLGAEERAAQLGYKLEEIRLHDPGMTPRRATQILKSRGIEGLLLAPQLLAGTSVPLDYAAFAAVTFGYSLAPRAFHLTTNHHPHSMLLALDRLAAAGYRRIGLCIGSDVEAKTDYNYLSSFWRFHHQRPEQVYLPPGVVAEGPGEEALFRKWFQLQSPDAVITSGGWDTLGWLKKEGVEAPRDIGYIHLSVGRNEPHISGIYENGLLIGRAAVDWLVGMLQRGERGFPDSPLRLLIEGEWREGKTLRSPQ